MKTLPLLSSCALFALLLSRNDSYDVAPLLTASLPKGHPNETSLVVTLSDSIWVRHDAAGAITSMTLHSRFGIAVNKPAPVRTVTVDYQNGLIYRLLVNDNQHNHDTRYTATGYDGDVVTGWQVDFEQDSAKGVFAPVARIHYTLNADRKTITEKYITYEGDTFVSWQPWHKSVRSELDIVTLVFQP